MLHWLKSKKFLTPFVQRIDEIQSNKGIEFRYVSTAQNPADIASRGCTVKMLNGNEFWWHGPTCLQKDHDNWRTWNVNILSKDKMDAISTENKEPKTTYEVSSLAEQDLANNKQEDRKEDIKKNDPSPIKIKATDNSSMSRLLRVTAWANRFIHNTRTKEKRRDWLNDKELKKARKQWILHVQFETRKCIINKSSSKDNIISTLCLQLDEDGIITCHGRFTNAINIPEETKKPIYLPKKEHWTTLLIKDFHKRLFQAGTSHTLSQMRHIYWIPQGRATVKAIIYQCGVCRKYNGGPYKMPKLADWPKEKISKGPFYVKENKEKVWICILTCVTFRAVHLEIVDDMTAEQFLMALRRFISRRNIAHTIILDNAPQFKLTKTTVDKA